MNHSTASDDILINYISVSQALMCIQITGVGGRGGMLNIDFNSVGLR